MTRYPIETKVVINIGKLYTTTGEIAGYRDNGDDDSILIKWDDNSSGDFPGHGGGGLSLVDHNGRRIPSIFTNTNEYYYVYSHRISPINKIKLKVKLPSYDRI